MLVLLLPHPHPPPTPRYRGYIGMAPSVCPSIHLYFCLCVWFWRDDIPWTARPLLTKLVWKGVVLSKGGLTVVTCRRDEVKFHKKFFWLMNGLSWGVVFRHWLTRTSPWSSYAAAGWCGRHCAHVRVCRKKKTACTRKSSSCPKAVSESWPRHENKTQQQQKTKRRKTRAVADTREALRLTSMKMKHALYFGLVSW